MTYKAFVHDELHFDAVLRNLEVIGEAVKNVSEETRQNIRRSNGGKSRDFAISSHGYFGVNDETVWDIVENEIPTLLATVKIILEEK